jgi:hypothetical protein
MRMSMRPIVGFFTLCVAMLVQCQSAQAAPVCTRDDVDFYLRKGFTTVQATAICSGAPAEMPAAPVYTPQAAPAVSPPPARTAAVQQQENDESFLNNAIDGYDVSLEDGKLFFTRKQCLDYGDQDPGGYKNRACPLVRYDISLKGLKVISTRRKFLVYGQNKIIVQGQVVREVIGNLDTVDETKRALIIKAIEQNPQADIPVRSGISLDRVTATLRKLAAG